VFLVLLRKKVFQRVSSKNIYFVLMMTAKNWLVETPFSLLINNSKERREEI